MDKKDYLEETNNFRRDYKKHVMALQIITYLLTIASITTFIWANARYGFIILCILIMLYNYKLNKKLNQKIEKTETEIKEEETKWKKEKTK